ncbi:MAG: DsrE/DsrF/DrsH-like family protein, partial [bacterium]
ATAMNSQVTLFFTFWGLNILRKKESVKVKKDIFEFPFGTQFIVSREKILKHSVEEYMFLRDKLEYFENIDSGCTSLLHPKKPCPCLHEISVWSLEVWWPIFFGEDKNLNKDLIALEK